MNDQVGCGFGEFEVKTPVCYPKNEVECWVNYPRTELDIHAVRKKFSRIFVDRSYGAMGEREIIIECLDDMYDPHDKIKRICLSYEEFYDELLNIYKKYIEGQYHYQKEREHD